MVIKIDGDIIGNDWKPVYEYYGFTSTCPADVEDAIAQMREGDTLEVKINSGGGDVYAGQEIYSILRARSDVSIEIESLAASAASVIAMAGHCTISPVGMIMIHCVSTCAAGNHQDMEKTAKVLKEHDAALASAYVEKTGMSKDEILALMNKETWLPADRAVKLGFVDGITEAADSRMAASFGGMQVTPEMLAEYKTAMAAKENREAEKKALLDSLEKYGA